MTWISIDHSVPGTNTLKQTWNQVIEETRQHALTGGIFPISIAFKYQSESELPYPTLPESHFWSLSLPGHIPSFCSEFRDKQDETMRKEVKVLIIKVKREEMARKIEKRTVQTLHLVIRVLKSKENGRERERSSSRVWQKKSRRKSDTALWILKGSQDGTPC